MIYIALIIVFVIILFLVATKNKTNNEEDSTPNKKIIITNKNEKSRVIHNGEVVKEDISKEEFLNTLSEEEKERFLRGDVKVTSKQIKKTTHYHNGEKTTEELENNETAYDKKAINSCPNCGASISLDYKECPYCKTIIN